MKGLMGLLPLSPKEGLPLPRGLVTGDPMALDKQVKHSWEAMNGVIKAIQGKGTIEEKFTLAMDAMAPPVPNIDGLPELRKRANEILAPALLKKWLPPLPRGLTKVV